MQVEDVQCKGKDAAGVEILEVYIKQPPALALLTQVKARASERDGVLS